MKTRTEKLNEYPIFHTMEGLAEEVVRFEAKTGMSLPDVFSYTFMQGFMTEQEVMVIGRMGPFYLIALEKDGETRYEFHENKISFRLWASELFHDLKQRQDNTVLTEEEKKNLLANQQQFFEKIETLCEEE